MYPKRTIKKFIMCPPQVSFLVFFLFKYYYLCNMDVSCAPYVDGYVHLDELVCLYGWTYTLTEWRGAYHWDSGLHPCFIIWRFIWRSEIVLLNNCNILNASILCHYIYWDNELRLYFYVRNCIQTIETQPPSCVAGINEK